MDKAARARWAILLSLLASCIAAIFYPVDEQIAVGTQMRPQAARPPQAATAMAPPQTVDPDEAGTDPFAPQGWSPAPPPAPAVVATPAAAVAVQPDLPTGPPPLPFQFVGRMNDGAVQTVYLSRGDQALVAHAGEALDGTYKVVAIEARRIDFEYTPTGAKQSLNLPAPDN